MSTIDELDQYLTPAYAAQALWEDLFGDATADDVVVEPTCGDGRMLAAVPAHISAFGYEIDPGLAAQARTRTGRHVTVGNFLDAVLPPRVTIAFGNPPFQSSFADKMLAHLLPAMPDGGRAGFILPAYFMQTPSRVLRWNRSWTISADLLPRTLWPRLMRPIIFATFVKDPAPKLRGLRLYVECDLASSTKPEAREVLERGSGSWREVVAAVLASLGGRAHLTHIYEAMLSRRPTENQHWREKVRQVLQNGPFRNVARGEWELA